MAIDFWNYGEHELPGWTQAGDVNGKKFGSWVKQYNDGTTASISLGKASGQYWLRIGNCYFGTHATPEKSAKAAENEWRKTKQS